MNLHQFKFFLITVRLNFQPQLGKERKRATKTKSCKRQTPLCGVVLFLRANFSKKVKTFINSAVLFLTGIK